MAKYEYSKETEDNLRKLEEYLRGLGSVAVAFSGGVDSTLLLAVASSTLGEKCIAVTAQAAVIPQFERDGARKFCSARGIKQYVIDFNVFSVDGFSMNPRNRCYICKKAIFSGIREFAAEKGIPHVADGTNVDDLGDFRPGMKAIEELGIKSPLKEVGLTKAEIRAISEKLGLPTWNMPSYACLASRFVYGEEITDKKLKMVESAEKFLMSLGYMQMRVRIHGEDLARIEINPKAISAIIEKREEIDSAFKQIGFKHVSLDLNGYKTGSMN